jgi:hypothetical protein
MGWDGSVQVKLSRVIDEYGLRMMGEDGWNETDLSGLKLEISI